MSESTLVQEVKNIKRFEATSLAKQAAHDLGNMQRTLSKLQKELRQDKSSEAAELRKRVEKYQKQLRRLGIESLAIDVLSWADGPE